MYCILIELQFLKAEVVLSLFVFYLDQFLLFYLLCLRSYQHIAEKHSAETDSSVRTAEAAAALHHQIHSSPFSLVFNKKNSKKSAAGPAAAVAAAAAATAAAAAPAAAAVFLRRY